MSLPVPAKANVVDNSYADMPLLEDLMKVDEIFQQDLSISEVEWIMYLLNFARSNYFLLSDHRTAIKFAAHV